MLDKVRVGFVGCGGIAGSHLTGLARMEDVELVAFCDISAEAAERRAAEYGGRAFTDPRAMLDAVQIDALFICLPPFAHGEAEIAAIEHRVPFLVEKPLGLDLDLMREIARRVEEADLLAGAGYMTRYRRSVQRARRILQQDPLIIGYGGWIGRPPDGSIPIHRWWVVKEKSGGQFHEQVTHTVDLVRYLAGEVEEVFAYGARGFNRSARAALPEYDIEDGVVVNMKLAEGAVVTLYAACAAKAGGGGVNLHLFAHEHSILFSGWEYTGRFLVAGEPEIIEIPGEKDIFTLEDRAFLNAVKTSDRALIRSTYADGVRTAAVTLAANQSLATGQPVRVAI
ncbi:MAG TPA: Gfo/Idh/MocA family oxidoreductase [Caldilineae bacterium]|nr:Gfo/Idh/MocA family oxidoreductase [Caldilineae bacterium]